MKVDLTLSFTALVIGTISLILQVASLVSPNWGSFRHSSQVDSRIELNDAGHFGPWQICIDEQWVSNAKSSSYETLCEPGLTNYAPPSMTTSAGILAVVNAVLLCQYIPLAIVHIVKIIKKDEEAILKTKTIIIFKIILTITIAILSVSVLGFFAGSKSPSHQFTTDYRWGFYVIVVVVVLSFGVTGVTEAEYFIFKRIKDREKRKQDPTGENAVTYGNPGFGTPKRTPTSNPNANRTANRSVQSGSTLSSTVTSSTMNRSNDSVFLETRFNGIMDRSTLRKVDPALDTGTSYPNPHFMPSPRSPNKSSRKNTQV